MIRKKSLLRTYNLFCDYHCGKILSHSYLFLQVVYTFPASTTSNLVTNFHQRHFLEFLHRPPPGVVTSTSTSIASITCAFHHCCPSTTISLASTFRAFHTHPPSPSLASGTSLKFHDHRSSTAHSDTPFSCVQAFSLAGGQPASVSFPRRSRSSQTLAPIQAGASTP